MPEKQIESAESKLRKILGIDNITPEIVVDKLDILSKKCTGKYAGVECRPEGRADKRMQELESIGLVRRDDIRSNPEEHVYRITVKGYDAIDIAQEYFWFENEKAKGDFCEEEMFRS